jgi:hypothetical protein
MERYSSIPVSVLAASVTEGLAKALRSTLVRRGFEREDAEGLIEKLRSDRVPDKYAQWVANQTIRFGESELSPQALEKLKAKGRSPFIDWTDSQLVSDLFEEYEGWEGGLVNWHDRHKHLLKPQDADIGSVTSLEDLKNIFARQMGTIQVLKDTPSELRVVEIGHWQDAKWFCKHMSFCVRIPRHGKHYLRHGPVYLIEQEGVDGHFLFSPSFMEFRDEDNQLVDPGVMTEEMAEFVITKLDEIRNHDEAQGNPGETWKEAYADGDTDPDYFRESVQGLYVSLGRPEGEGAYFYEHFKDEILGSQAGVEDAEEEIFLAIPSGLALIEKFVSRRGFSTIGEVMNDVKDRFRRLVRDFIYEESWDVWYDVQSEARRLRVNPEDYGFSNRLDVAGELRDRMESTIEDLPVDAKYPELDLERDFEDDPIEFLTRRLWSHAWEISREQLMVLTSYFNTESFDYRGDEYYVDPQEALLFFQDKLAEEKELQEWASSYPGYQGPSDASALDVVDWLISRGKRVSIDYLGFYSLNFDAVEEATGIPVEFAGSLSTGMFVQPEQDGYQDDD